MMEIKNSDTTFEGGQGSALPLTTANYRVSEKPPETDMRIADAMEKFLNDGSADIEDWESREQIYQAGKGTTLPQTQTC
jgi:hypothetical protein